LRISLKERPYFDLTMSKDVFPVNDYSRSYWMNNPDKLANHRSTADLPLHSDIVIIGSGYAGATCAYYLYKHEQLNKTPLMITMLEARETCSGATGRNGGHLNADMYYSYKTYKEKYGQETAEAMIEFEAKHIEAMSELVSEENIQCDWDITRTCHTYFDPEIAAEAKASYQQRYADGGNVGDIHEIPSNELLSVTRVKNALYGITYTSATIHPYKLIHHLLNKCVERGMNLQTHTPVLAATHLPSGQWSIVTSRGTLQASKVIFATNAYTGGIVPLLNNKIVPIRATVCRILPSTNYMSSPLEMTYSIRSKGEQFDYMLPRQTGDRSIILGGSKPTYLLDKDTWYNNWDDSTQIINEKSKQYFEEFMPKYFDRWGIDYSGCKEVWTGIFGRTSDLMPFVGELPDQTNGYVIAGFNGHGMSRILLCARALVDLVLERVSNIEEQIPKPFIITKARLQT
jgi:glycine/D-amino acid oxidase-like deaminating enzyme